VAMTLALVETTAIFAAMCVLILWARPLEVGWAEAGALFKLSLTPALACGVAFYVTRLYDLRAVPTFGRFVSRLPRSLALAVGLLAGLSLLHPHLTWGETWLGLAALGLVLPLRVVSYDVLQRRPFRERVLIMGTSPIARRLVEELQTGRHYRYRIVAVVDDGAALGEPPFQQFPGACLAQLATIVERVLPDRIVIALGERRGRLPVRELLEYRTRGIVVEDAVEAYQHLTGKLAIEALTPSNLIFARGFTRGFLKSRLDRAFGRAVSLGVAVFGLLAFAPLFGLLALAIKLDSPGPVFFVHDRVGLRGRRFRLIKFRTMHPSRATTSEWAQDNRDRVTRVGRWLRRFRLDELPQFLNILRGDMNLVGPRPHPVSNFDLFVATIPHYWLRSVVRPGLTGWAQIRYGYANNLDEETEKMRYDLYYIKHRSAWLDVRILLATFAIVVRGRETPAAPAALAVTAAPHPAASHAALSKAA
jgi:exopolysaccharide biosynthesis polyprenyl glycosylphosphotransferase